MEILRNDRSGTPISSTPSRLPPTLPSNNSALRKSIIKVSCLIVNYHSFHSHSLIMRILIDII